MRTRISSYDAIVKEMGTRNVNATLDDVPDYDLKSSLEKLMKAPNVQEAVQIIDDAKLDTIFDMAGTVQIIETTADIQNIAQKTINWYVLGRVQPAYYSFKDGL